VSGEPGSGAPGGIRTPAHTDSKPAALSTELQARLEVRLARWGLERGSGRQAANPAYEQAPERDEVGLLVRTFAESPEPGTSPAPNTSPPGLDSGQVVEHPPPDNAPAGLLGHWQG
jgi:hypothetical protein